jgi:hypothetical protein
MGIPVTSLVPSLRRATSPPGVDLHPDATDAMFSGYVEDALWMAVLKGAISGYAIDVVADPHQIVPVSPNSGDLPGELGQLIVEFAALNVISGDLMNLQTTFKATAGPVSIDVQRSATVLVQVLKNIQSQLALSLEQIGKFGFVNVAVFDAIVERTYSVARNESWWVR